MAKDEFGQEYLRRSDGGALIITAWACAAASIICAALGVIASSFDLLALAGAFGSFWIVFFITGYVSRAIYFVAGDDLKPRSRRAGLQWRSDQGYRPSGI